MNLTAQHVSRTVFIIISILMNNFSLCQITTENETIQEQLECYDDIVLPLIFDNITWTTHILAPVPPIPLEGIQNPTREDTLSYKKRLKKYYEVKEAHEKKISVFIDTVLYSVNEFYPLLNDTCNFNFPNLPDIKLSHQNNFRELPDNPIFEYSSNNNADLKLKFGRILFDEKKSNGHLIFQIEDMFGFVSTKCYRIKFESKNWIIDK